MIFVADENIDTEIIVELRERGFHVLSISEDFSGIPDEDVLKTAKGKEMRLNLTEITRRVFVGLGRLSFLRGLRQMADLSKKALSHYENYPTSPDDFPLWQKKNGEIYRQVHKIFG